MEKTPKVSVIIPVYNVEKYLAECLDSVVNQTLRDIEIICVDDGSTDGSLKILMEYAQKDERVKVICKENGGQSSARNKGMEVAKGEYVYFIDDDDWIELYTLEELIGEIRETYPDIVCFEAENFLENSETIEHVGNRKGLVRKYEYGREVQGKRMFAQMISSGEFLVPPWRQIYKRAFLIEQGLTFYEGSCHEDDLFSVQTMLLAPIVSHVRKVYYHHRIHNAQVTAFPNQYKDFKAYLICYRELMAFLLKHQFVGDVAECIKERINGSKKTAYHIYHNLPREEQRGIDWTNDPFTLMLFKEYEEYPWEELAQGAELRGKVDRIKATLPGKILFKVYKGLRYLKKYGLKSTVKKTAEVFKRVTLRMLKK